MHKALLANEQQRINDAIFLIGQHFRLKSPQRVGFASEFNASRILHTYRHFSTFQPTIYNDNIHYAILCVSLFTCVSDHHKCGH